MLAGAEVLVGGMVVGRGAASFKVEASNVSKGPNVGPARRAGFSREASFLLLLLCGVLYYRFVL